MRIWEQNPEVARLVQASHRELKMQGGHDICHAMRVGETARMIALNQWQDEHVAELAGLAGLCHNADRLEQKRLNIGRREVPHEAVEKLISSWLAGIYLGKEREGLILQAVLRHDGRNDIDDSPVQIALMDADRVVNLAPDVIIRAGQFLPDLPAVDYVNWLSDPEATYKEPRTVLRDISHCLEWVDPASPFCVRTKLGKKMAGRRAAFLRLFFNQLKTNLEEVGLL